VSPLALRAAKSGLRLRVVVGFGPCDPGGCEFGVGGYGLLQRPRDVPVRTSIGAMAIVFYMVLTLAAMNDIIALKFHISLNATTWIGRIGMVILPPLVYFITYRWCIGLQRSDRSVLEHGVETGIIKRLPHGAYIELHQPLGPVDDHGHPVPLEYQGAPVLARPCPSG